MGHYVYRYLYDDETVYIGRTINIDQRIKAHQYDAAFQNFCNNHSINYSDLNIEYVELSNSTEENILEKILINKYKPQLNIADKHESLSKIFDLPLELNWVKYEYPQKNKHNIVSEMYEYINSYISEKTFEKYLAEYLKGIDTLNWLYHISQKDYNNHRKRFDDVPIVVASYLQGFSLCSGRSFLYVSLADIEEYKNNETVTINLLIDSFELLNEWILPIEYSLKELLKNFILCYNGYSSNFIGEKKYEAMFNDKELMNTLNEHCNKKNGFTQKDMQKFTNKIQKKRMKKLKSMYSL